MFNMLDIYRSRLFNKRRRSRFVKRMSIFAFNNRADTPSLNAPPGVVIHSSATNPATIPSTATTASHSLAPTAQTTGLSTTTTASGGGRRFSISSSKESLTPPSTHTPPPSLTVSFADQKPPQQRSLAQTIARKNASISVAVTHAHPIATPLHHPTSLHLSSPIQTNGGSVSLQNILAMETDQFESMINRLSLSDEDQLLNLLTEYFLSREDPNAFSCSSAQMANSETNNTTTTNNIRDESNEPFKSTYSFPKDDSRERRGEEYVLKKFASMNVVNMVGNRRANSVSSTSSSSSSMKKIRNRCYYASVQAHMAQAFKSMDGNFDNRLSFDEFSTGLRALLNEHALRRVCAKSYLKFAVGLVNDERCLRRLFDQLDINGDGSIDFGKFTPFNANFFLNKFLNKVNFD